MEEETGEEERGEGGMEMQLYNPTALELERAAARARTSTSVVLEQLSLASAGIAEWVEYHTERGNPYYYNESTGESRWTLPVPETLGLSLDLIPQHVGEYGATDMDDEDEEEDDDDNREGEDNREGDSDDEEEEEAKKKEHHHVVEEKEDKARRFSSSAYTTSGEEEEAEKEARQAQTSSTARTFVEGLMEETLDTYIKAWVIRSREEYEATQKRLQKTSHADFRVNKKKTRRKPSILDAVGFMQQDDSDSDGAGEMEETDQVVLRERRRKSVRDEMRKEAEAREKTLKKKRFKEAEQRDEAGLDGDVDVDVFWSTQIERTLCQIQRAPGIGEQPLRRVELVECGLVDDDAARLASALANSVVVHVELGRNRLTSSGVKVLSACARTCVSLRELHLNENRIGDDGAEALREAFFPPMPSSTTPATTAVAVATLHVLNVMANPIAVDGARSLARALSAPNCALRHLRIGGPPASKKAFKSDGLQDWCSNRDLRCGDRGACLLAAALMSPVRSSLTALCLAHSGLGAAGARALAAALYTEPPIRRLDLTGNSLEGAGAGRAPPRLSTKRVIEAHAQRLYARLHNPPNPLQPSRVLLDTRSASFFENFAFEGEHTSSVTDHHHHHHQKNGGVAALARAFEASKTVQVCLVSDRSLEAYFAALIRHDPDADDWSRKKALGADAAAAREWVLDTAASLGFSVPSRGVEETAVARMLPQFGVSSPPPPPPPREEEEGVASSDAEWPPDDGARATSLWSDLLVQVNEMWPSHVGRHIDDSTLDAVLDVGLPTKLSWHELTKTAASLRPAVEARKRSAEVAESLAGARRSEERVVRRRELTRSARRDSLKTQTTKARCLEKNAEGAKKRALREFETADRSRAGTLQDRELRLETAKTLAENTADVVQKTRGDIEHAEKSLALLKKQSRSKRFFQADCSPQEKGVEENSRILASQAFLDKTKAATGDKKSLAASAKRRVATLKTAANATDVERARLWDAYEAAVAVDQCASQHLRELEELEKTRDRASSDDASRRRDLVRKAEADAARATAEAASARIRAKRLASFVAALEHASQNRRASQEHRELVPHPSGAPGPDGALASARAERARSLAELTAAEATLAASKTDDDRAAARERILAARARCEAADRAVDEAQLDATAVSLAARPVVTETLAAQHRSLVLANKPRNGLAAAFNAATVRNVVDIERDRKDAYRRHHELEEEARLQVVQRKQELQQLQRLSPRAQLAQVKNQIDQVRALGYPTTKADIARLRKLRGFKARARDAVRKQKREQARHQELPAVVVPAA